MFLLEGKGCWEEKKKKKSNLAQTFPSASECNPPGGIQHLF